jgi:hypothetical protein
MGDEDPITKSNFNTLMSQKAVMMVEIQSHKNQLEALASGTSSTTPPAAVDSSDKPLLNEDDSEKVMLLRATRTPTKRVTCLGNIARRFHIR